MVDAGSSVSVSGLGPHLSVSFWEVNFEEEFLFVGAEANLDQEDIIIFDSFAVVVVLHRGEAVVVDMTYLMLFSERTFTYGARVIHDIYSYMNAKTIFNQDIESSISGISLRLLKSDIGCHFEILRHGQLVIGMYFLYGETIHKAVYGLGGAIYGFYHDDELTEDVMSVIEANKDLLGGYELTR